MRTLACDHDHRREQATAGRVAHRRETGFGFGVVPDRGTHRRQECALRLLGRGMRTAPAIIIRGNDAVVRRQPVPCTPAVGPVSTRPTTHHAGSGATVARVSAAPGCLPYSTPPAVARPRTART